MKIFRQIKEPAQWIFLAAIVIYIVLFGFNSITRSRLFSPDSMNYVDVARNIASGRGITQSTLGFNQVGFSADDEIPTPLISQPPLYPVMITILTYFGINAADSALFISIICFGIILLITFSIALKLFNKSIALLSVCLLLIYYPLRLVSSYAWSEPPGMVFVLLSIWLLLLIERTNQQRILLIPALAGLTAGLAFSTRYAFLPLIFVGIIYILIESNNWKQRMSVLIPYLTGFAIPSGFVLIHNIQVSNSIIPESISSNIGIGSNVVLVVKVLFGNYFNFLPQIVELVLLSLILIITLCVLAFQQKILFSLREVLFNQGRYLLTIWVLSYLTFLIILSSLIHIDQIDPRLVFPAGMIMVLLLSAFIFKIIRIKDQHLNLFGLIIIFFLILFEIYTTITKPVFDVKQYINSSERLSWIAQNTTEHDLIIGDDTMDIPFFLSRSEAVSFSPSPSAGHPTYEKILAYSNKHFKKYEHIYLVLRNRYQDEEEWSKNLGPFIKDLISGHYKKYSKLTFITRLSDGYIFELSFISEKS